LLIAGGIWVLSSQSTLPQPKGILEYDKLQHLIAYLALAAGAGLWVSPAAWRTRPFPAFLLVAFITSVYGVVDEIHQFFTPGRDCNVWDWAADTLGAVIGAALMTRVGACLADKTESGPEEAV
jgi:VanZ family protein